LIWAKVVKGKGLFDFAREAAFKNRGRVSAPSDAKYIVPQGCVSRFRGHPHAARNAA
jgi:adenine-specific DNA-methyltransferase